MNLKATDVHIYSFPLHCSEALGQQLAALLSTDEQQRAAKFVFEKDRRKFIIGRGRLRQILGNYLGLPPENISFEYGAHGKPTLADVASGLKFNLSHSHELAALAVSIHEVGIDIEWCRPMDNMKSVAEKVYNDSELSLLFDSSPDKRIELFYKFWTCKEAFIKLTGEGFSRDPQTIQLPTAEICSADWIPAKCEEIQEEVMLKEFKTVDGYKGAVAVAESKARVYTFGLGDSE